MHISMEKLGWDGSGNSICSWNTQQHEIESLMLSDPAAFAYMVKHLAPAADSTRVVLEWNAQQCQEITKQTAKSEGWSNASSTSEMCSSPMFNRTNIIMNTISDLTPDFGVASEARFANGIVQDVKAAVSTATTGCVEPLDFLLSATNSNSDASAHEDDGISMIFSDCKSLWKIGSTIKDADHHCCIKELDEAISQASSNYQLNQGKSTGTLNTNSALRSNDLTKAGKSYRYLDLARRDSSSPEGVSRIISENQPKPKRASLDHMRPSSSNISFQQPSSLVLSTEEPDSEAIVHMKEMIYRAAAFRPVNLGMEVVEKPKRKNVRISNDPQTVAARQRRERISERIRVLQKLVPGGRKMDTATMLDEAANYLKFLRSQVKQLEAINGGKIDLVNCPTSAHLPFSSAPLDHSIFPMQNPNPILHPKS